MGERAFSVAPPPPPPALELYPSKNLNLHSHFGTNEKLYISAKLFHPELSVSWYAGSRVGVNYKHQLQL